MSDNKLCVISQPRYLPACNYIRRMHLCDLFIYLDTVQFSPRDYENRNQIKTPSGPIYLTIPVKQASRDQLIKEIKIDNSQSWQKKHLRAFQANYARAPYFKEHRDFLELTYEKQWEFLIDLNEHIIQYLIKALGIQCSFKRASEYPKVQASGQELLIELCKASGSDFYLSGPQGRNYIDNKSFEKNKIGLVYDDYQHPEYSQLWDNFTPYMNAFDLVFNKGPESFSILCGNNLSKEELLAKCDKP